jgi:hypothetical protein
MGRFQLLLMVGFLVAGTAIACTIVDQPPPREAVKLAALVFRGSFVKSETLPPHPETRGRQRFAVTLRVAEYWKGSRGEIVTLYDVSPRTVWVLGYKWVEYLIFASEEGAREYLERDIKGAILSAARNTSAIRVAGYQWLSTECARRYPRHFS